MDEPKPTSAPASANRDQLAGIIQSIILMAGWAVMVLPIVLWREFAFLTSLPTMIFLFLFALVFLPLVMAEIFGPHEPARIRPREKVLVDLIPFYARLGRILRPVLSQFSWWRPFRLGRFGEAVLLPDSIAIFNVVLLPLVLASCFLILVCASLLAGQPFPVFWRYLLLLLVPTVLASPFVLTAVLWVSREEVRLVRFFIVIPYWAHRVPHDAEFAGPIDDGPLAFTSRSRIPLVDRLYFCLSRSPYELQLGTTTSAVGLYHHISKALERTGWKPAPAGFLPRMSRFQSPELG
jgi:hypothetical protein